MNLIPECPDYSITRDGIVYSELTDVFMKPQLSNAGYEIYALRDKDGLRATYQTARLLLLTYCPVPNSRDLTVDHLNRDKLDNRLENLVWATRSENQNNRGKRVDNSSGETYIHLQTDSRQPPRQLRWAYVKVTDGNTYIKSWVKKNKVICEKVIHIHQLIQSGKIHHPHSFLSLH